MEKVKKGHIVVIGSGIAGLMAALQSVQGGSQVTICSVDWNFSGSIMAEGGINAALDAKNDSPAEHEQDTLDSAQDVVSKQAVHNLCEAAPDILRELYNLGVQFSMTEGHIAQRPFGGQGKARTCYAGEETGKQIVTALLDAVRGHTATGAIRFIPARFTGLLLEDNRCVGCQVYSLTEHFLYTLPANAVIMACGGLGGLYSCPTTAFHNTGDAAGILFKQGVAFSNLEFVQYHPTTVRVGCRRILISESARGEGGRLCTLRDGKPYYFLEEANPELRQKANLLTRDKVSRACYFAAQEAGQVYLDLRDVPKSAYKGRLADTLEDCEVFLKLDPTKDLIPVEPGVHYFMGGIKVDESHRTNIAGLYAAGECCAQYHGANRLGGNSLLGAAFGGKVAANTALAENVSVENTAAENMSVENAVTQNAASENPTAETLPKHTFADTTKHPGPPPQGAIPGGAFTARLQMTMDKAMGIVRSEAGLATAYEQLEFSDEPRVLLARAAVKSALERKESRGAHYRSDYPATEPAFQKVSAVTLQNNEIVVEFQEVAR